jgi:hypothetical protein
MMIFRIPNIWAIAFALADVLWLIALHVAAALRATQEFLHMDTWWSVLDGATKVWNAAHLPFRRIFEPLFFPVVTPHPLSTAGSMFLLYEALCALQFALIGHVIGHFVRYMSGSRKKK